MLTMSNEANDMFAGSPFVVELSIIFNVFSDLRFFPLCHQLEACKLFQYTLTIFLYLCCNPFFLTLLGICFCAFDVTLKKNKCKTNDIKSL